MAARPNRGKTEQSMILSIRCSKETKSALQKLADADRRTLNNYIVNVLEEHVNAKK